MAVPQGSKAAYLTCSGQVLKTTEYETVSSQEELEENTEIDNEVPSDMAENHGQ